MVTSSIVYHIFIVENYFLLILVNHEHQVKALPNLFIFS